MPTLMREKREINGERAEIRARLQNTKIININVQNDECRDATLSLKAIKGIIIRVDTRKRERIMHTHGSSFPLCACHPT